MRFILYNGNQDETGSSPSVLRLRPPFFCAIIIISIIKSFCKVLELVSLPA